MVKNKRFDFYANKVSSKIDDRTARKEAYEEIYAHLIESKEDFLEKGMSEEEAEQAVLFHMGDAGDLGGELDHIHTPKLRLWHILIIGLILALILASFYGYYFWSFKDIDKQEIKMDKTVLNIFYYRLNL
ncbi:permease prefix domain 1-containing protein [Clostridium sp.]|uniref:permease prefix domain 1-containing protein n=1 Tax=Clostridium sp. TaxID=1506 RepID=UPI003D6CA1BF